ncbi:hypothetical protein MMC11_005309 [Xylographa trunciseda]|nr:hypothetical protein [Xylographa trunciseda]
MSASNDPQVPKLIDITLQDIAAALDNGFFSSEQLVHAYLKRISEVDTTFNSVLEVNGDAIQIARRLDEERRQSGRRGPLHGVPILLKDNIHTADNMSTTAGSLALLDARLQHEATVATKLRKAGAILLGKTNMSEWANFRSENSSGGWSARGQQCVGPYCPLQDPSGSSSGSGVATALGLALASIGTETDGSITHPAGKSNIVGIKPTVGLVARDGVIPISEIQDTIGPMARTVKDAAEILTIIAGKSEFDKRTQLIPFEVIPDYGALCQDTNLSGLRIGVPNEGIQDMPLSVIEKFDYAKEELKKSGAEIIENVDFACLKEWDDWDDVENFSILCADFKKAIDGYLQALDVNPKNFRTLEDLITWTENQLEEEYPSRDTERWHSALRAADLPPEELLRRREKSLRCSKDDGILGALTTNGLDALLYPCTDKHHITFAARAGYPIITVPLGFYPSHTKEAKNKRGNLIEVGPGVPFCLCIIGKAFSEEVLIRIAYAFEQLTQVRNQRQPFQVPTTEIRNILANWPTKQAERDDRVNN